MSTTYEVECKENNLNYGVTKEEYDMLRSLTERPKKGKTYPFKKFIDYYNGNQTEVTILSLNDNNEDDEEIVFSFYSQIKTYIEGKQQNFKNEFDIYDFVIRNSGIKEFFEPAEFNKNKGRLPNESDLNKNDKKEQKQVNEIKDSTELIIAIKQLFQKKNDLKLSILNKEIKDYDELYEKIKKYNREYKQLENAIPEQSIDSDKQNEIPEILNDVFLQYKTIFDITEIDDYQKRDLTFALVHVKSKFNDK